MEFDLVCSSCLSGDAKGKGDPDLLFNVRKCLPCPDREIGKGGMSYIIFKDDLDKSIYVKSSFSIDF